MGEYKYFLPDNVARSKREAPPSPPGKTDGFTVFLFKKDREGVLS